MGPHALVGAPLSLSVQVSVCAALSTLGLTQGGAPAHTMLFPSFCCKEHVCLQAGGHNFCFFANFYFFASFLY